MTIRNCLVVSILVRWCKRASARMEWLLLSLAVSAALLAGHPAQTSHTTKKSTTKATPKAAPKAPATPTELAGLVRAYREAPSAARRAAVESWGATHPKERAAACFALGAVSYEQRDFGGAAAEMRKAQAGLPQIADYIAYYLSSSRVEMRQYAGVVKDLAVTHESQVVSPFSGRARMLEARALQDSAPAEAVRMLREHAAELPQPEGDLLLGESLQAAGSSQAAAETLQRVYCQYVTGDVAVRAATALASLRVSMGASYPALSARDLLRHADRLADAREYSLARTEYRTLADTLGGTEHDQALVRVGWVDYLSGKVPAAASYLRSLDVAAPDAEAERLADLAECERKLDNDGDLRKALKRLESEFPKSSWRAKALLSGANHFLVVNRPEDYLPLYRALYDEFPSDSAAGNSHWKVTFDAYLHRHSDAVPLLEEQLERFPRNGNTGAALYFLGRAAEEHKDNAAAVAYYQQLVKLFENYYYAMLARERLARPELRGLLPASRTTVFLATLPLPAANPVPTEPNAQTTARIERSRILRNAGLPDLADSELRFGARNGGQPALLGLESAKQAEVPHTALRILKTMVPDHLGLPLNAAPRQFWELLYPLPYRADLFADAQAQGLDPYLVAGLIRQESEFHPGAVSPAKAYGLMQVLPVTGRQFARSAGIPRFTPALLTQPAVNLKIGTIYLHSLLEHSGGHVEQTLAAYNAGPMRLAEWVTWTSPREAAEFVESIPFTETRDYVQAVMRNADMYRRLYP